MSKDELKLLVEQHYGMLFEPGLIDEIAEVGTYRKAKPQDILIDIGEYIKSMPLLLQGSIKIIREDQDGNELFLYYLERGDTCAFSLTCCMGNTKSAIRAVVEDETELVLIPVEKMDKWIVDYKSWRDFVFQSYNARLEEMLEAIDSIAFLKLDERVLKYLRDRVMVSGDTVITNTHQQLARELNTSRVVVSRLLKQLEKQGKIKLERNRIEFLDL